MSVLVIIGRKCHWSRRTLPPGNTRLLLSQPALLPLRTLRATVLHRLCTPVNSVLFYSECCDFSLRDTTLIKSESEVTSSMRRSLYYGRKKDGTDGRATDRCIVITARRGQRDNQKMEICIGVILGRDGGSGPHFLEWEDGSPTL